MARFMAERLARESGLPWIVGSAGTAATEGATLSDGARRALVARGLAGLTHAARRVDEDMVAAADKIYALTRAHREALAAEFPEHARKFSVLREEAGLSEVDVADPAGGTDADYALCADRIEEALKIVIRRIPRA
jgi:protein-tyrosine phosphatase